MILLGPLSHGWLVRVYRTSWRVDRPVAYRAQMEVTRDWRGITQIEAVGLQGAILDLAAAMLRSRFARSIIASAVAPRAVNFDIPDGHALLFRIYARKYRTAPEAWLAFAPALMIPVHPRWH